MYLWTKRGQKVKHPSKNSIQKWIDALRSGEYDQTKGLLQNNLGHCCLGVACDIFIPESKLRINSGNTTMYGGVPSDQKHAPKWLKYMNEVFDAAMGVELTDLNDHEGFSFDEIADLLQLIYIEGALDVA